MRAWLLKWDTHRMWSLSLKTVKFRLYTKTMQVWRKFNALGIGLTLYFLGFLGPSHGWGGGGFRPPLLTPKSCSNYNFSWLHINLLLLTKRMGIPRQFWTWLRGVLGPPKISWVKCIVKCVFFANVCFLPCYYC